VPSTHITTQAVPPTVSVVPRLRDEDFERARWRRNLPATYRERGVVSTAVFTVDVEDVRRVLEQAPTRHGPGAGVEGAVRVYAPGRLPPPIVEAGAFRTIKADDGGQSLASRPRAGW